MQIDISAEKLSDEYTQYLLDAYRSQLRVDDELQNFRQVAGRHVRAHVHDLENMRVSAAFNISLITTVPTVSFDFYPRSDQLQQLYRQAYTHCTDQLNRTQPNRTLAFAQSNRTNMTAATTYATANTQPPIAAASIPADAIKMLAISLLVGTCSGCVGGGCNVRLSHVTYCGFAQWQSRVRYVHGGGRCPDIEAVKSLRVVAKKFSRTISIEYILRQVSSLYGARYRGSGDSMLVSLSYGPTQHQSWLIRTNTSFATLDLAREHARACWERVCTMAAEWSEALYWWKTGYHRHDFADWVFSMVAHVDKNPLIIYASWFRPPAHDKIISSTQTWTSCRWFNRARWSAGYGDSRRWIDPFFIIEIRVLKEKRSQDFNETLHRINIEDAYVAGMGSDTLDFASLYPSLMMKPHAIATLHIMYGGHFEDDVKNMLGRMSLKFAGGKKYSSVAFEEHPYTSAYPTISAGIYSPIHGDVYAPAGSSKIVKPKVNRREQKVRQKTTKWQTAKVTKWQKVRPGGYGRRK